MPDRLGIVCRKCGTTGKNLLIRVVFIPGRIALRARAFLAGAQCVDFPKNCLRRTPTAGTFYGGAPSSGSGWNSG